MGNGVRRVVTALICAVGAAVTGCGNESAPTAADCIKIVDESGEVGDECLPVAPDSERVDLGTPTFSMPTSITNRLHPTSLVAQTIYGGQVDGKPFRTEVTRLPNTKAIPWRGAMVETVVIQYVAYLDGRIHEVAMDWYAQADDGSVWYFGEDVFNFEDGRVADTNGTWLAGEATPAAMIMPADPRTGNVYRPENAPGVAFEEVRVEKTDQEVAGPTGKITGAIEVSELHMDGTRETKVFAPGYGEFSTGNPGGDLEAVSLAVPIDSRTGSAPTEFGVLSETANGLFQAAATADAERVKQAAAALDRAWNALRATGIPPRIETQMATDIGALTAAVRDADSRSAQAAALRIALNELDLRLLYQRVIDVDLGRLALWAQQLPVDVAAADAGAVLADVAALERVWERTRYGVETTAPVDDALQPLRRAADEEDLPAAGRVAVTLAQAVGGLRARD